MPRHNGTEWKTESAWWVKVAGEWKKSTTIWKKVAGVWEKMTLSVIGLVSTFAGSGINGSNDGVGDLAEFSLPYDIDVYSGFAYVCGYTSRKIRKINLSTAEVTTFAGSGANGDADGVGVLAEFKGPIGIAIESGFAYVCDSIDNKIRKINLSTAEVTTFAGSGVDGDADGVGVLAEIGSPIGIAIDSGFAYVCSSTGRKVRKINLSTADVTTFAGSSFGNDDGVGILAKFKEPRGITIDSGFAYVSDSIDNKIRKINLSTAEVTTFAGSGVDGDADGVGVLAEFEAPDGMSSINGVAYVSDYTNNKIKQINLSTAEVTTFAGSGVNGDADGVGVLAEFTAPTGMQIYLGNLYVCDAGGHTIRKIYVGEP